MIHTQTLPTFYNCDTIHLTGENVIKYALFDFCPFWFLNGTGFTGEGKLILAYPMEMKPYNGDCIIGQKGDDNELFGLDKLVLEPADVFSDFDIVRINNQYVLDDGTCFDMDGKPYLYLQEAIDAIPENGSGTILVKSSCELTSAVLIDGNRTVTLLGNSDRPFKSVIRRSYKDGGFQGAMFVVNKGSVLNIGEPTHPHDILRITGGYDWKSGSYPASGSIIENRGGTLNLYGYGGYELFDNYNLNGKGGAVYNTNGGVFNMYGGSIYSCQADQGAQIYNDENSIFRYVFGLLGRNLEIPDMGIANYGVYEYAGSEQYIKAPIHLYNDGVIHVTTKLSADDKFLIIPSSAEAGTVVATYDDDSLVKESSFQDDLSVFFDKLEALGIGLH